MGQDILEDQVQGDTDTKEDLGTGHTAIKDLADTEVTGTTMADRGKADMATIGMEDLGTMEGHGMEEWGITVAHGMEVPATTVDHGKAGKDFMVKMK